MTIQIQFDNTYESLPNEFYTKIPLHGARAPELLYFNQELAEDLGFDVEKLAKEGLPIFSGQHFPEGASSIAQAYMGHQFGHQTMLGDGRANLIGEVLSPEGKRYDLQLKGSGPTPYSRGGDGRASLGPMLKEYIFSEALYHLGIPSSRSLALVKTGQAVFRQREEEGAILTRVMSSHIRVGTFEFAEKLGDPEKLKALADYAIDRHDPDVKDADQPYLAFYESVVRRQASTIAKWMAYGFVHGVMNTDNTSISGESFDYGPCAFIDHFDVQAVYSSIDRFGRYAFGQQPNIGLWNLHRFAETLMPLIKKPKESSEEFFKQVNRIYQEAFTLSYDRLMRARLDLDHSDTADHLLTDFYSMMEKTKLDYHQFFIDLSSNQLDNPAYQDESVGSWLQAWKKHVQETDSLEAAQARMKTVNPSVIPRNYWLQQSIEKAEAGDFSLYDRFYQALKDPFAYAESHKEFGPVDSQRPYVTFCGT